MATFGLFDPLVGVIGGARAPNNSFGAHRGIKRHQPESGRTSNGLEPRESDDTNSLTGVIFRGVCVAMMNVPACLHSLPSSSNASQWHANAFSVVFAWRAGEQVHFAK